MCVLVRAVSRVVALLAVMLLLVPAQHAIAVPPGAQEGDLGVPASSEPMGSVVWAGGVMPRFAGKSGEKPRHLRYWVGSDRRSGGMRYPFVDIKAIAWSSWGGDVAVGRGQLEAFRRQADLIANQEPVSVVVTMTVKSVCFGQGVYRRFAVELEAGHRRPAWIPASMLPHREEGLCRPQPTLLCPSLVATGCKGGGSSVAYLPVFQGKANAGMSWTGLGGAVAVGTGFMHRARPFNDPRGTVRLWTYPIRMRFERPRWCVGRTRTGFVYTRAVTEVFGAGVAFDWIRATRGAFERAIPPYKQRQQLLAQIGSKGVKRRSETTKNPMRNYCPG